MTEYSSVFASRRVTRSTSVRFSAAPRIGKFGEKFVVSTTERVALEVAARVAVAEADVGRRMAAAQIDDALESLALPGVDAERDDVLPLHDAAEPAEVRLRSQHAAVAHALILRAVVAVHALRVVERGHFVDASARADRISQPAQPFILFLQVSVYLQERQAELAVECGSAPAAAPSARAVGRLAGSTTSDVRRPVGFAEVNTAL